MDSRTTICWNRYINGSRSVRKGCRVHHKLSSCRQTGATSVPAPRYCRCQCIWEKQNILFRCIHRQMNTGEEASSLMNCGATLVCAVMKAIQLLFAYGWVRAHCSFRWQIFLLVIDTHMVLSLLGSNREEEHKLLFRKDIVCLLRRLLECQVGIIPHYISIFREFY